MNFIFIIYLDPINLKYTSFNYSRHYNKARLRHTFTYLILDDVHIMGIIVAVSEPGEIGKLSVEILLPPAEQIKLLLVEREILSLRS